MSLEISLHKRLVDIRIAETVPSMTTLIDEMSNVTLTGHFKGSEK